MVSIFFVFFFNCNSLHARLNSTVRHQLTRKRRKRWRAYRKADQKELTDKRCLLTQKVKPFRLKVYKDALCR